MAYSNQPDIKESRGGLRDSVLVSALAASWLADRPHGQYDDAVERLLDVRDCIHLVANKDTNMLLAPYQVRRSRLMICRRCLRVLVARSRFRLIPRLLALSIR